MINPNKLYKASQTGIITKIHNRDAYIYVSDIKNFKRFSVGDEVKCRMQFSITGDKFLIKGMRRVLK